MHAFGVDDTLQLLALISFCLDVDQFNRAQVVWFWEVLKRYLCISMGRLRYLGHWTRCNSPNCSKISIYNATSG
jgi:hypothetical protein